MRKASIILMVELLFNLFSCSQDVQAQIFDRKNYAPLFTPKQKSSLFYQFAQVDSIPYYKGLIANKQHDIDSLLPLAIVNRNRVQKVIYYLDMVKSHPSKRASLLEWVKSAITLVDYDTVKLHFSELPSDSCWMFSNNVSHERYTELYMFNMKEQAKPQPKKDTFLINTVAHDSLGFYSDSLAYYERLLCIKESKLHTIRLNLLLDRNRIEQVKLYLKIVKAHPSKIVFFLGWIRRAADHND